MPDPYILVAPNGARRGPKDHPALPITTDQIVATARACHLAGAHGLHLHVRDDAGAHSLDAGRYREVLAELARSVPELDLQITTEAAAVYDVPAQLACLEAVAPTWASISVREIARAPELIDRVYATCADQATRVQHILYDREDAELLTRWQGEGRVRAGQDDRLFVLGRYATGQVAEPEELDGFLSDGPPSTPWMVCAFGPQEHACLLAAAAHGGDVRVGFENGLTNGGHGGGPGRNGPAWADNAASVAALVLKLKETQL